MLNIVSDLCIRTGELITVLSCFWGRAEPSPPEVDEIADSEVKINGVLLPYGITAKPVLAGCIHDISAKNMPLIIHAGEGRWLVVVRVMKNAVTVLGLDKKFQDVIIDDSFYNGKTIFHVTQNETLKEKISVKRMLFRLISENKSYYCRYFLASFLLALTALTIPVFSSVFYDKLIPSESVSSLFSICGIVVIMILLELFLRTSRDISQSLLSRADDVTLDISFMENVIRTNSHSYMVSTLYSLWVEFQRVKSIIFYGLIQKVAELPVFIIYVTIICMNLGFVGLVPVVMTIVGVIYSWYHNISMDKLGKEQQNKNQSRDSWFSEVLFSLDSVKNINSERLLTDWVVMSEDNSITSLKIKRMMSTYQYIMASMSGLNQLLIMMCSWFLVVQGRITTGAIISSVIIVGRMSSIMNSFSSLFMSVLTARRVTHDMGALFDSPTSTSPNLLTYIKPKNSILVKNLSWKYDDVGPDVLREIDLEIPIGQKIAIVGECGAGKSTLLSLISGMKLPHSGAVIYDGVSSNHLSSDFFFKEISCIYPKDGFLSGTLEYNFLLKNSTNPPKVVDALKLLGCDFILNDPGGMKRHVSYMEEGFSSGQLQKLLLARSISGSANIFVWDEPTSSLDEKSESEFFSKIDTILKGKTLVMTTHRKHLLQFFDRVIYLKNGKITGDYLHAELFP
ncbi:ATP-binding cassette domain-containing protein [Salmonella enterica]|nr:ATP-binding cassette domain-containing protein [Salmonella enterica]